MLTYRGDKFVKGKKFKINEEVYCFSKYDSDDFLIFESTDEKRSLRISKEDFDEMSRYDLVNATEKDLDAFYDGSALTFEGCTTDKDNLDYLYNWLKELGAIKGNNLPIYTYKGSMMNEKYGLTGSNKYPADLNFITVKLEDINYTDTLAFKRFEIGGRWFDDIVGNNAMRQDKMNEAVNMSLSESKVLIEKINQENKEINAKIAKILRSKTDARKYEKELNDHGITVDYSTPQGVILKGPNGKYLSATSKEVMGPTINGQAETHREYETRYKGYIDDYSKSIKDYEDKLEKLNAMDRDDIIRKYNDVSTDEAMTKHKEEIEKINKWIAQNKEWVADSEEDDKNSRDSIKMKRRAGHKVKGQTVMGKPYADSHVDYLNYLTKEVYDKPFAHSAQHWLADKKFGKNGEPSIRNKTLQKYDELKDRIDDAKRDVDWHTYDDNDGSFSSSYAAMTDKQLEKKIKEMRDKLEKEIEELRKNNIRNNKGRDEDIAELKAREKELDDFLKSKGVRESIAVKRFGKMLKEEIDIEATDTEYIHQEIMKIYDDILTLAKWCQLNGHKTTSDLLDKCLSILDMTEE